MSNLRSLVRGALVLLLLAVGCPGFSTPAMSQNALAQKSAHADELNATAQRDGSVRVIVMLRPAAQAGQLDLNSRDSIASAKAQVAADQDAIIARHFGSASAPDSGQGFQRSLSRFDLTHGFVVNLSAAELQSLASEPDVVSISYDRLIEPLLTESVPLIGRHTQRCDISPIPTYAKGTPAIHNNARVRRICERAPDDAS